MPATQEGSSSRLLPSIVRVNSESDIDEVINEEVAKLPVIVNNTIEGELKEKWWMKQRNRFNIRATRTKHKNLWYKKTSIHHHLPPLQGVCNIRMLNSLYTYNCYRKEHSSKQQ